MSTVKVDIISLLGIAIMILWGNISWDTATPTIPKEPNAAGNIIFENLAPLSVSHWIYNLYLES